MSEALYVELTTKGREVWARNETNRQKAKMPLTGMAAVKRLEVYHDSTTAPVDERGRVWVRCPFEGAGFAVLLPDEWQEAKG